MANSTIGTVVNANAAGKLEITIGMAANVKNAVKYVMVITKRTIIAHASGAVQSGMIGQGRIIIQVPLVLLVVINAV